jgi:hypothetical protein
MSQRETTQRLEFDTFASGYYANRNELSPPLDRGEDALIQGRDLQHTDRLTWLRRPGLTRWSNQAVSSSTTPLSYFSHELANSVNIYTDRTTDVYQMTTSTATVIYNKGIRHGRIYFGSSGDTLYFTHGGVGVSSLLPHRKKINNDAVKVWGITAPSTAPTVTHDGSTGQRVRIGWKYTYVYKDSTDGHVSSPSPISTDTGNFLNDIVHIAVTASAETRVDKIDLYRTTDGGSTLFYHSEVSNTSQTIDDTSSDDSLNTAIIAPGSGDNEPPPAAGTSFVEHNGRFWMISTDKVYFNGDSNNGVKEECWPLLNNFKFPTFPHAIASTSQGLLVFCTKDIYLITGELLEEFRIRKLRSQLGALSQFCVAADGDIIYVYTTSKELLRISDRVENIGLPLHPVNDLGDFDPTTAILTVHRAGNTGAIYLCNVAGDAYRFGLQTETWSPRWSWSSNAGGSLASIQVALGDFRLVNGPQASSAGYVWYEDSTDYDDDGGDAIYPDATFGSLQLAPPQSLANLENITVTQLGATQANVSIRPQEVGTSAAFRQITSVENEPPELAAASSLTQKKYFPQVTSVLVPLRMRHLQVRLAWTNSAEATELLRIGINYTVPQPD